MNSMVPPLLELEASLFLDALERSGRNILLGGRHRNPAWLDGMLELLVAARTCHLEPAVLLEPADDFPAVPRGAPFRSRIHISYTLINIRKCFQKESQ